MPRDPEQSLQLALRSMRLLGIASALFGLLLIIPFGYFNRLLRFRLWFIGIGTMVWFMPGVLLIVSWLYLNRRSKFAMRSAIGVCILQVVFATILFALNFVLTPISIVPVVLTFVWILAAGQLLLHLLRARPAVDYDTEHHPGFSAQVVPLANRAEEIDP